MHDNVGLSDPVAMLPISFFNLRRCFSRVRPREIAIDER